MKPTAFIQRVIVGSALLAVSCAPPTPDEFVREFFETVQYRPEAREGPFGNDLTPPGFVCRENVWKGPRTPREIISRPLLGLYADGRILPVNDLEDLPKDDLGREIDTEMERVQQPGWPKNLPGDFPVVDGRPRPLGIVRTSQTYLAPAHAPARGDLSRTTTVDSRVLLNRIVRVLGPPRYAQVHRCGATIALYYGDLPKPTPRIKKCDLGKSMLFIQIINGRYTVMSNAEC